MTSEDDRAKPAKRRRTRAQPETGPGKYVCLLMWAQHWHGPGGGTDIEQVTDSASSVRSMFSSLMQALANQVSAELIYSFGKKIVRPVAENALLPDDLAIVTDAEGGNWEVTAHRRSDIKVLADTLTEHDQCPRLVQIWENGRDLLAHTKCTCEHTGQTDEGDGQESIGRVPSESVGADAESVSEHTEEAAQTTETPAEAGADAPSRSTRASARNRSRAAPPASSQPPAQTAVAAETPRRQSLKSISRDLSKAKKSAGVLWKAKVEQQKRKVDVLKHRLAETEQNLEQFRSNWIKEKHQNEKLWARVEAMQRRFNSLTRSAEAADVFMKSG